MTENIINLYIHFPFCLKKCSYCDFYSECYDGGKAVVYLSALNKEIDHYYELYPDIKIGTLYLGGGSPNLIGLEQFHALIAKLKSAFDLLSVTEFTVETNPVGYNSGLFQHLFELGVNRINVGIQSFNDFELQILGRIHSVNDSTETLPLLQGIGFEHVGLDLIYGIPGQTMDSWSESLNHALNSGIDHLSLYNLSYEEGTPLFDLLEQGKISPLDNEIEKRMYLEACRILEEHGFEHYEISNWAKPNCESRHNQAYWEGRRYLGLGPAAHSYDGKSRWWNVRSVDKYIEQINAGQLPIDSQEVLTEPDREIEHLFLRLRTSDGLSRSQFENLFHIDFSRIIEKLIKLNLDEEYWIFDGRQFKLTPGGWFVSDSIIYTILGFIEEIRNDHKKS
ncbi:MAG: radical SAM family heme chaperone HemW [Candidatus Marinimicrobia bacterium]|nr:radical SAM family heme chaperone HemW [Candidatus Neomarinimicrobiota bacterium]